MRPGRARIGWALAGAALLAGCAGGYRPVRDVPVKIGHPYTVRGVTYTPHVDPRYDAVGYASWYGEESGDRTANGEKYRPKGISAAHKTLPLPTYVEVTSLQTGRTILVRVNDRGPFARGRIIDLSRGAADLLGIREAGSAPVRVRVVDPSEADKKRLRKGKAARRRDDASRQTLMRLRERLARSGGDDRRGSR